MIENPNSAKWISPFSTYPFKKMSSNTTFLAKSIMTAESIDEVRMIIKSIAEEPCIMKKYKGMSSNHSAVWYAEERTVNVWGFWIGMKKAQGNYKPHKKTKEYLVSIKGDVEKFIKLAMDKYWSVLGSESKKPFGCYSIGFERIDLFMDNSNEYEYDLVYEDTFE